MIETASLVDRLLGLLSHTMPNLDQATAHFEDALNFCHKAAYRPELAWTRCDYADTNDHTEQLAPPATSITVEFPDICRSSW